MIASIPPNLSVRANLQRMLRLVGGIALVLIAPIAAHAANDDPKALFERATVQFRLGQFHDAALTYQRVYELHHDPALLYDCAQSHRLANEPERALVLYKSFLASKPDAANRVEVEGRIAELERVVAEQAKERPLKGATSEPESATDARAPVTNSASTAPNRQPTPVVSADRSSTPDHRSKRIAGVAIGVAGLAIVAGGVVCGVLANQTGNNLTKLDQTMQTFDYNQQQLGKTEQILGGVFLGVGAAAVVTGTVLYLIGRSGRGAATARALIAPATGGVGRTGF